MWLVVSLTACGRSATSGNATTRGTQPSTTAETAGSSTTVTSPSANAKQPTCRPSQLRLSTRSIGFASGQFTQTFTFENKSDMSCELAGWPGVQAVVDGQPQATTAIRVRQNVAPDPPWVPVPIAPGDMASFNLYGQDFDAANNRPCAQTTSGFLVIPPNDTEQMSVAGVVQDCGNRFWIAPVIAGGTDNLAWSTEVSG